MLLKNDTEILLELYEYLGGIATLDMTTNLFLHYADKAHNIKSCYKTWNIPKKNGTSRHIEAPCGNLKIIQRALLPLFHQFPISKHVYGLGGQEYDAVANAEQHTQHKCVIQMDIQDFFPSTTAAQLVWSIDSAMNLQVYNPNPESYEQMRLMLQALVFCLVEDKDGTLRLPMGAPTSPILANIAFSETSINIYAYCMLNNITYTRYMDDLTFSCNKYLPGLQKQITLLVEESSAYKINHKKSQVSYQGNHQQKITGVVVNHGRGVGRAFKKQLRAEIEHYLNKTHASKPSQYIQGKLAYMHRLNPIDASKMKKYFFKRVQRWQNTDFSV